MGFLSNLFGGNKEDKALREAMAHIHRILDDEQFQLELVHPAMKAMLESAPAYDKDPNGTGPFGFTETNPIPVNGPIGQLAYLGSMPFCVELDNLKDTDAPIHQPAAMLVAAD